MESALVKHKSKSKSPRALHPPGKNNKNIMPIGKGTTYGSSSDVKSEEEMEINGNTSLVTSIQLPPKIIRSNSDSTNSTTAIEENLKSNGRLMKMWKSKSPHFYVYNYLIIDDFALGGRMIDRHFLRTQSNEGMTDQDMEWILNYFNRPAPPGPIIHRKKKNSEKVFIIYYMFQLQHL